MDKRLITGSTAPFFEDVTTAPPGGVTTWTRTSDGVRIRLHMNAGLLVDLPHVEEDIR